MTEMCVALKMGGAIFSAHDFWSHFKRATTLVALSFELKYLMTVSERVKKSF